MPVHGDWLEAVELPEVIDREILYQGLVGKLSAQSLSIKSLDDIIDYPKEMMELLSSLTYTVMERRKIHEILKAMRQRDAYVHSYTEGPA